MAPRKKASSIRIELGIDKRIVDTPKQAVEKPKRAKRIKPTIQGFVPVSPEEAFLAVDQASRSFGWAIIKAGTVIASGTVKSEFKVFSLRVRELYQLLSAAIHPYKQDIKAIVFENNLFGEVYVTATILIPVLILPQAYCENTTAVFASEWKAWWRRTTGVDAKPKGKFYYKMLKIDHEVKTDDEADAIMIGLCYLDKFKRGKLVYIY